MAIEIKLTKRDGIYKILGITPLYELEEELGIDFKDADNETINGYLISKLDRVPEEGETPEIEDEFCHYKVTKVSDRMIKELKLTLNKPIEAW